MTFTASDGFPYYISLVGPGDFKHYFTACDNYNFLASFNNETAKFSYAPGKWNIKQVVGHITDHERIMMYRALRFSRKDITKLSGYDQELLVANSRSLEIEYADLLEDLKNVRRASISLMNTFSKEQLQLKGFAWKFELTVEEVLKATIGHEIHHINILKNSIEHHDLF